MNLGDMVPALELQDQNGETYKFSNLIGHSPFVVFFYPKDFTPGCTKEACSFRDKYDDFRELGAKVIGISSDSSKSHLKFASRYELPFILLADEDKKARQAFGVGSHFLGLLPGRETFVFNQEGRLIQRIQGINAKKHMPEALAVLKKNQN